MRYVLPVLWMTLCFHITKPMGQNQRQRYVLMFRRDSQVAAPGEKLLLIIADLFILFGYAKNWS